MWAGPKAGIPCVPGQKIFHGPGGASWPAATIQYKSIRGWITRRAFLAFFRLEFAGGRSSPLCEIARAGPASTGLCLFLQKHSGDRFLLFAPGVYGLGKRSRTTANRSKTLTGSWAGSSPRSPRFPEGSSSADIQPAKVAQSSGAESFHRPHLCTRTPRMMSQACRAAASPKRERRADLTDYLKRPPNLIPADRALKWRSKKGETRCSMISRKNVDMGRWSTIRRSGCLPASEFREHLHRFGLFETWGDESNNLEGQSGFILRTRARSRGKERLIPRPTWASAHFIPRAIGRRVEPRSSMRAASRRHAWPPSRRGHAATLHTAFQRRGRSTNSGTLLEGKGCGRSGLSGLAFHKVGLA